MASSDLLAILNQTTLQKEDNKLYQVIAGLIDRVGSLNIPEAVQKTKFVSVDTSVSAQTVALNTVVDGFTIIKDSQGNASANNITLLGTVDGVVDPVISTDFGEFRVYGYKGAYHGW